VMASWSFYTVAWVVLESLVQVGGCIQGAGILQFPLIGPAVPVSEMVVCPMLRN
jgi:hypothetical protein